LIAIEFSKEPDVFHILKYVDSAYGEEFIVSRTKLNEMIASLESRFERDKRGNFG
jgi:hypothetical protein